MGTGQPFFMLPSLIRIAAGIFVFKKGTNLVTLYLKVTDLRKGFGSIVLRPCGLTVSRRAIQMRSFSFRSRAALSEWAGNLMKSSMWQVNWSILPVWSGCVRCLATGCLASSRLSFVRSLVCSLYLWSNRRFVWPTYCLPQVLQVRP